MGCPDCGEETRKDAVLCGLCKRLFVAPARPSQAVPVLGRGAYPSQAVPVLQPSSQPSGAVPVPITAVQSSRPISPRRPTRPAQVVSVLGRSSQEPPGLDPRPAQPAPVLGARPPPAAP